MTQRFTFAPQSDADGVRRRAAAPAAPQPAAQARPADARLLRSGGPVSAQMVLQLQRQHGNRAAQSLIAAGAVPAVQAADEDELQMTTQANGEDEEMMMTAQANGEEEELMATTQAEGEEEELMATAQAEGEDEEMMMTAQAEGEEDELMATAQARGDGGVGVGSRIQNELGGGVPLDSEAVQRFGGTFGSAAEGARVHTDGTANQLSESLNAKAFTTGNDIFFRAGEYAPGTSSGDHLLAHELTHVAQQGAGSVPAGHQSAGQSSASGSTTDPWEREAEATADAFSQGQTEAGGEAAQRVKRV